MYLNDCYSAYTFRCDGVSIVASVMDQEIVDRYALGRSLHFFLLFAVCVNQSSGVRIVTTVGDATGCKMEDLDWK